MAAIWPPLHETNAVWVERGTYLLCFAAMWLGESKVQTYALPDYPRFKRDIHNDKSLCETLHSLLSQCDAVVGHNARSFDIKVIRGRLITHDLEPLPPFKIIDTLQWARSLARFDSNKLDAIGQATGIGRKIVTTGADLWKRCYHGDKKAFDTMREYCGHDVHPMLTGAYNLLKGWTTNHPNLAALSEKECCPVCQSRNTQRRGFNLARTKKTPRFQCQDCGNWFSQAAPRRAA